MARTDERVRLERHGAVAELVLCAGERGNAIDHAMALALGETVAEVQRLLASGGGPAAVLLRAEGPNFCVGGDLRDFTSHTQGVREHLESAADVVHGAILGLSTLPAPLVVATQGAVAGGGMGIALTGDVVVAARSARFRMAYTAVGLTPDLGTTWLLPRVVGRQRALDLTLTNRTLGAEEALSWGLVSRVVDDTDLDVSARGLAAELAGGATQALGAAKALLIQGADESDQAAQLAREARSIAAHAETPYAQQAMRAFLSR
ncbi:MAG TPA: enoyl-CoA hydratase/isomerase family protein [Actinomycetes bacterium]|nr:enoyl-CoA hydratase/isomerase family protein [Actinomycetes bacterium]